MLERGVTMNVRFCEYCGKDIEDSEVFCPYCGSNPIMAYTASAQTAEVSIREHKSVA
jgi:uncharacterized Zn finger protein (UPF0148 family)